MDARRMVVKDENLNEDQSKTHKHGEETMREGAEMQIGSASIRKD